MQLKYNTTTAELLGYFLLNPNRVPDYFNKCGYSKKQPLDLGLPWIALDAIQFLEENLTKEMTAFEFGAGASTLFYAQRVKKLKSVESDREWFDILSKVLKEKGITNTELTYSTYDRDQAEAFPSSAYCNPFLPNEKFDVIIIDGIEVTDYAARPACFKVAERHIKPGGMIVVDDSWRYTQLHNQHHAKDYTVFKSIGPGRKGLTSTDIYFY